MTNILSWLMAKTNGYKSIIGYLVATVSKLIESKYPDAPAAEIASVLQYVGEAILIWGLGHKAVKVNKEPAKKKK